MHDPSRAEGAPSDSAHVPSDAARAPSDHTHVPSDHTHTHVPSDAARMHSDTTPTHTGRDTTDMSTRVPTDDDMRLRNAAALIDGTRDYNSIDYAMRDAAMPTHVCTWSYSCTWRGMKVTSPRRFDHIEKALTAIVDRIVMHAEDNEYPAFALVVFKS